jgi:maleylpyruvate isomerase
VDTEIAAALGRIQDSTHRLLGTASALTDAQAGAASRLPGWTRGHVLTHLARNADGFRNLLRWAATGVETPMYAGNTARDADITAGTGRPAADLTADVRDSAAALAEDATQLPAAAWAAPVERRGHWFPARMILSMRLRELEIHHVDLGAGYQPADWPADFVAETLPQVAASFAGRPDMPSSQLLADGWADPLPIGPPGPESAAPGPEPVIVHGPPGILLAWLTGRADPTGLRVTGTAAPPSPPPWR